MGIAGGILEQVANAQNRERLAKAQDTLSTISNTSWLPVMVLGIPPGSLPLCTKF